MYVKPDYNRIMEAIYDGWSDVDAQRGYTTFDMENTGILCIQRLDCIYYDTDVTDEDCARQAEIDKYCKIIPVSELPEKFPYKYFVFVDTPDNRQAIVDFIGRN